MITINLLPEGYRKPAANPLRELPRSPLALLMVGLFVGLWLLLATVKALCQGQLVRLTARVETLQPQKHALDELQASLAALREHQALFQRLDQARSQWALRLNTLSDLMPDGMWLTDLSVGGEPPKFTLQGSAIGRAGDEMAKISRLVQDLKADPGVAQAVRDLQLGSVEKDEEGEIDVARFTVTADVALSPSSPTP